MAETSQLQALLNQARAAERAGQWAVADGIYTKLRKSTDNPEIVHCHALVVLRDGHQARAATMLRNGLKEAPDNVAMIFLLTEIYLAQNRHDHARAQLERILAIDPDHRGALKQLGKLDHNQQNFEQAETHLRHLLSLYPDDIEGGLMLGAVLANDGKRYEEATPVFERVLELAPNSPSALHNFGLLKRFQGDIAAAEPLLVRACEIDPNNSDYAFSLGICYMFKEDMEAAYKWLLRAVEIKPKNNAAQVYVAFALFLMGRMTEGWKQYEKRLELPALREANYERPRWRGEDIRGKPLLLISEQGMGDNIQFIRYAAELQDRGATIIVATHDPLIELFKSVKGVSHVMKAIPEPKYFYRYCSLMSLPYVLGTDENSIPGKVPYLRAPQERVADWRARLSRYDGLRVGLCWRGNPHHTNDLFRSSSLQQMLPLLDIEGARFFCLSKALPEHERDLPDGIINIGKEFNDFTDVAAVMESLDLVVTVDTSICHLAGALGRPVWTMLARGPDFRWTLSGETTPWYPTMKLFRQDTLGDWGDVLRRIASEIKALVAASV